MTADVSLNTILRVGTGAVTQHLSKRKFMQGKQSKFLLYMRANSHGNSEPLLGKGRTTAPGKTDVSPISSLSLNHHPHPVATWWLSSAQRFDLAVTASPSPVRTLYMSAGFLSSHPVSSHMWSTSSKLQQQAGLCWVTLLLKYRILCYWKIHPHKLWNTHNIKRTTTSSTFLLDMHTT